MHPKHNLQPPFKFMPENALATDTDTHVYRRPPVIQRIISIIADISPDDFAARIDTWKEVVSEAFPIDRPITQWVLEANEVNADDETGLPLFENLTPQVKITPHFERRNASGNTVWSLRCSVDALVLTLHSEREKTHSFREMHDEITVWLPRWMSHFDVKGINLVMLDYVNLLGRRTTPAFVLEESNSLEVDRLLRVFSRFQGSHMSIIPPYDCEVGFLYHQEPARTARVRLQGLPPSPHSPEVRVDFLAMRHKTGPELITSGEALAELDALHEIVIERFDQVFTDEAKASFR